MLFSKSRYKIIPLVCFQNYLARRDCPYLVKLEIKLTKELQLILLQEELIWRQKSMATWLKDGDKNTRFFHIWL